MSHIDLAKVPYLYQPLIGPLQAVEELCHREREAIEAWIANQLSLLPVPVYCSVDLRNAGYKLAAIDTNLFPAGFNNLGPDLMSYCIQAAKAALEELYPQAKNILLIPEDHTRNIHYYENVAVIAHIFSAAGYTVRIGSLLPARQIELPSGNTLTLELLMREKDTLKADGFIPDIILLNNDLSAGVPELLQGLSQPIVPPLTAGWFIRLKSRHFHHYQEVVAAFAARFKLDPWLLSPLFQHCTQVNFMAKDGEQCLVKHATSLLSALKEKYQQYHITDKPFLVIKADAGTYGMAVMMIEEPEALLQLNRKERTRMSTIKGARLVNQVIIQEGIGTIETWGKEASTAEPVIYMIGREVVGGFYRVHSSRSDRQNLNAPGMRFHSLVVAQDDNPSPRFYFYGVVARLALIASARELSEEKPGSKI